MPKELNCGDLMPGCRTVIEGQDEAEILAKAAAHAREHHGVASVPREVVEKVKAAIRERPSGGRP
jgi:predicted small metal-binding protein